MFDYISGFYLDIDVCPDSLFDLHRFVCVQPSQMYKAQSMLFVQRSFGALSTLNPKKACKYLR